MYCFDTDILSATIRRDPPLHLLRRLARVPPDQQFTTSITLGELVYGAEKKRSAALAERVRDVVLTAQDVLPFDAAAGRTYGLVRAQLERAGTPLAEPDLRIASIALCRGLTVVTGNTRHFDRVPGLVVENWLRA